MHARYQNVVAFRRRIHLFEQSRIAERRDGAASRIDPCQLRGGVVFEQIFVMGIL